MLRLSPFGQCLKVGNRARTQTPKSNTVMLTVLLAETSHCFSAKHHFQMNMKKKNKQNDLYLIFKWTERNKGMGCRKLNGRGRLNIHIVWKAWTLKERETTDTTEKKGLQFRHRFHLLQGDYRRCDDGDVTQRCDGTANRLTLPCPC